MASVASRNLFDLLTDEVEDVDVIVEEKKEVREPVTVQKKVDRSRASRTEARIRHEYPQRGGIKASPANRTEESRTAPRDLNVGPRLSSRREHEEGGGDYPPRSSRGARAGERLRGRGGRHGREFDRHSGTDRYDSEKKETQGWGSATSGWENNDVPGSSNSRGNAEATSGTWQNEETTESHDWGAGEKEFVATPWESNDAGAAQGSNWDDPSTGDAQASTGDAQASNWDTGDSSEPINNWDTGDNANANTSWNGGKEATTDAGAVEGSQPVVEEEVTTKTLDEYLAEKAQKTLDIVLPEVRKPNEGVDDSQWKDAVQLQKEEEEDFLFTGKEQSFKLKSKKTKSRNVIEINTFVERPSGGYQRGGGGGGGGRGRGRGRGRGGSRDENFRGRDSRGGDGWGGENRGGRGGEAVNINDNSAFPSLGSA